MPKTDDKVLKVDFAAISDILEAQGVIAQKDDLAKMIEQNRLADHSLAA